MPSFRVTRKPVGLVIFDCDGVLVDSEPLAMRVLQETVRETGTTRYNTGDTVSVKPMDGKVHRSGADGRPVKA